MLFIGTISLLKSGLKLVSWLGVIDTSPRCIHHLIFSISNLKEPVVSGTNSVSTTPKSCCNEDG